MDAPLGEMIERTLHTNVAYGIAPYVLPKMYNTL